MGLSILSLTIWREARGDGTAAMQAVANVIRNRSVAESKSIYAICVAPNQFTSISVHADPETTTWANEADPSWISAQAIAAGVISGVLPDNTHGAQYYDNPKTANSEWFEKDIVADPKSHPKTAVIGKQIFYA
jgi:spore germination cell wall hydrolase CwlJ-like protein